MAYRNISLPGATFLAALALSLPLMAQADDRASTERDRSDAARLVFGLMSDARYAYRPQKLDDALSSRILDAYVSALDPGNSLRSEADTQLIEQYRYSLDEAIKRGKLDPVYEIADALQHAEGIGYDKDRVFEIFLNAYVKASDDRGSYRSPFVEAAAKSNTDVEQRFPRPRLSFVEANGKRIGVIRLSHLYPIGNRTVSTDVLKAIAELGEEKIGAVVLDLRGNEGGPLREVVDLAGLFLGPVPVMQIREQGGRVTTERSKVRRSWEGPLAVLVDRRTAAGAEILAAALQDHGRGVLMGEQTFGSGTIQNPVDLDLASDGPRRYGSIQLTIAEVFRLDGQPLDGRGVLPDLTLQSLAKPESRKAPMHASKPIAPARGYSPAERPFDINEGSSRRQDSTNQNDAGEDPALAEAAALLSRLVSPPVGAPESPADK